MMGIIHKLNKNINYWRNNVKIACSVFKSVKLNRNFVKTIILGKITFNTSSLTLVDNSREYI